MPNNKLTDNEIIKALECCINNGDCRECALNPKKGNYGYCTGLAIKSALDLINRQKAEKEELVGNIDRLKIEMFDKAEQLKVAKAEIERLTIRLRKAEHQLDDAMKMYNTIKAEAYKEFAERVKTVICDNTYPDFDNKGKAVCVWKPEAYKDIDNLLKELVGDAESPSE